MPRTVSLGILDHISIASPCDVRWDDMQGDDRVRRCAECDLNVFNLSSLTRAEAEQLILTHHGRLCAGFFRRADGTILTRDCPIGLRAARAKVALAAARLAAAVALLVTGSLTFGAHRGWWTPRLTQLEPFSTIRAWVRPGPPLTITRPVQTFIAGKLCTPILPTAPGNTSTAP